MRNSHTPEEFVPKMATVWSVEADSAGVLLVGRSRVERAGREGVEQGTLCRLWHVILRAVYLNEYIAKGGGGPSVQ